MQSVITPEVEKYSRLTRCCVRGQRSKFGKNNPWKGRSSYIHKLLMIGQRTLLWLHTTVFYNRTYNELGGFCQFLATPLPEVIQKGKDINHFIF